MNIQPDHFFDHGRLPFGQTGFHFFISLKGRLIDVERGAERVGAPHLFKVGGISMRTSFKLVSMIGAAACLLSVSACATTESVEKAQAAADSASSAAAAASAAASKAQGSADQAAAAATQAGTSAQGVSDKLDTFIREECSESKKEAQKHSACGVGTGAVKG